MSFNRDKSFCSPRNSLSLNMLECNNYELGLDLKLVVKRLFVNFAVVNFKLANCYKHFMNNFWMLYIIFPLLGDQWLNGRETKTSPKASVLFFTFYRLKEITEAKTQNKRLVILELLVLSR